ncbi:unnamed protein product, partial [Scytosiphon promiscuus]
HRSSLPAPPIFERKRVGGREKNSTCWSLFQLVEDVTIRFYVSTLLLALALVCSFPPNSFRGSFLLKSDRPSFLRVRGLSTSSAYCIPTVLILCSSTVSPKHSGFKEKGVNNTKGIPSEAYTVPEGFCQFLSVRVPYN